MIKKTLSYENFDGETETGDFYFHLGKGDLVAMMLEAGEEDTANFAQHLKDLVAAGDNKRLIGEFRNIIGRSYGIRTPGGGFRKSDEIREDFVSSPAFDELFFQICTDATGAAEFVNNLIPKNLLGTTDGAPVSDQVASKMAARTVSELPMSDLVKNLGIKESSPLNTVTKGMAIKPAEEEKPVVPAAFGKKHQHLPAPQIDPNKKLSDYTQQELVAMPTAQFQELMERSKGPGFQL